MYRLILTFIFTLQLCIGVKAQLSNMVTYAGDSGKETFYDVVQISNGTFLVAGYADNLNWIDNSVPQVSLGIHGILNGLGSNRYGFILQLSEDLSTILQVVHFPQGAVEDVRYIKLTSAPGEETGDIFISGGTEDTKTNKGGYFIAKLNNNFVNGIPTDLEWAYPIWAEGYVKDRHPWDVGSDGKVICVRGQSHAYDWSAAYRLDENGNRDVVAGWRSHWPIVGGEFRGYANDYPDGIASLDHSGIVFKRGRCDLRSWTMADYMMIHADENGGMKQGKWPLDFMFDSPCDTQNITTNGPGYTGYSPGATSVYGPSSIVIDRRTNDMYIGLNLKTILPNGNPDFEPAVIAMDSAGYLRWWTRLYHEMTPSGNTVNSSPDQYIDALAVDYSTQIDASLIVNARCHGNNVENFWEGNTILANPSANGFQNRFTGTIGNIHISWLGKLKLNDGTLHHSTYVAELQNMSYGTLGTPHPDPNLDGWPDPNGGWPNVNTTRLAKNNMKVTADGSVCTIGAGRRTLTTANAYQKMPNPLTGGGGHSSWNSFVRIYKPDFSVPKYSSLVVGAWDTLTQVGGGNTNLYGVFKTADGVIAVGRHEEDSNNPGVAKGNDIPVTNVPTWGENSPMGQSAILVHYVSPEIADPNDSPVTSTSGFFTNYSQVEVSLYPNPTNGQLTILSPAYSKEKITVVVRNIWGQETQRLNTYFSDRIDLTLEGPSGLYFLEIIKGKNMSILKVSKK